MEPIGFVRAPLESKAEAARQPAAATGTHGRIELLAGHNFEHALDDLAGWEYIWVIFHFHLNEGWRPKVLPPRSTTGRKGVFATRSPHRPNALGLSAVRLERIDGLTLHLGEHDMLDGTPVLDIKPYVAYTDAHPQARSGWLEDAGCAASGASASGVTPADPIPRYEVLMNPLAGQQAAWIESRTGLAIGERIRATLALGPEPHPYRRIRREGDTLQLAVKEWRVRFTVTERLVRVAEISTGYRASQLAAAQPGAAAARRAPGIRGTLSARLKG
jgi:tRNA-Thr(GGU) m(6)t(6)A37 methyltransferase TsaA